MKSLLVSNFYFNLFLGHYIFLTRLTISVIIRTFCENVAVQDIPRNLTWGSSSGNIGGGKALTSMKLSSTREIYLEV